MAEQLAGDDPFQRGWLRLTHRRSRSGDVTKDFNVPVLDFNVADAIKALEPGHTPVPPRETPALTVAQAVEQTNQPKPKAQSARSAAPIGAVVDFTGSAGAQTQTPAEGEAVTKSSGPPPDGTSPTEEHGEPSPADNGSSGDAIIGKNDRNRLFGILRGQGLDDTQIRDLVNDVIGEPSTARMTVAQMEQVLAKAGA
jgi:hypothetical protein